jgi:hypothetical protein
MAPDISDKKVRRADGPRSNDLHPFVYVALGVAVLWFVFAVWGFGGQGDADYLLAIVSDFFIMAIAIPSILWHVAKAEDVRDPAHENDAMHDNKSTFREWASLR